MSNAGQCRLESVYYHRADSLGLGFNRTASGSNALKQYSPEAAAAWSDPATCDENYLLGFTHLPLELPSFLRPGLWVERASVTTAVWTQYERCSGAGPNSATTSMRTVPAGSDVPGRSGKTMRAGGGMPVYFISALFPAADPGSYRTGGHSLEYYKTCVSPMPRAMAETNNRYIGSKKQSTMNSSNNPLPSSPAADPVWDLPSPKIFAGGIENRHCRPG